MPDLRKEWSFVDACRPAHHLPLVRQALKRQMMDRLFEEVPAGTMVTFVYHLEEEPAQRGPHGFPPRPDEFDVYANMKIGHVIFETDRVYVRVPQDMPNLELIRTAVSEVKSRVKRQLRRLAFWRRW